MGLGKTVITLALILKRPPPAGWRAPLALAQPPPTATLALPHASTPSTLAPLAQPPQTPNLATPGATTLFDPAPSAQTPLGSQGLRRNGATLIAATPALLGQWDNEVCPFCETSRYLLRRVTQSLTDQTMSLYACYVKSVFLGKLHTNSSLWILPPEAVTQWRIAVSPTITGALWPSLPAACTKSGRHLTNLTLLYMFTHRVLVV
jgi:hypothetical protein